MGRVIIAFYDSFDSACQAVSALFDIGFRPNSISLLAHQAAHERNWRDSRTKTHVFLTQPCIIHLSGIGPVMVSGYYSSAFCNGATSPKSLVRLFQMDMISESDAHMYTEGVRRQGVLVFVRAEMGSSYRALRILEQYNPVDIQDLAERWRRAGWTHFDDKASPVMSVGLNWPSSITSQPGDAFFYDTNMKNWPQNMINPWLNMDQWM